MGTSMVKDFFYWVSKINKFCVICNGNCKKKKGKMKIIIIINNNNNNLLICYSAFLQMNDQIKSALHSQHTS